MIHDRATRPGSRSQHCVKGGADDAHSIRSTDGTNKSDEKPGEREHREGSVTCYFANRNDTSEDSHKSSVVSIMPRGKRMTVFSVVSDVVHDRQESDQPHALTWNNGSR